MDIIKHILGICGDHWHLNIYTITIILIVIKLIYEKNSSKTFWSNWW